MMTKSQLMELVFCGTTKEVMDHSEMGRFDVTAMREVAERIGTKMTIPLDCIHDFVRDNYVWEEARVQNLPRASWMDDPGIILVFMEHDVLTHCVIDGTHRIIRRAREGYASMAFWEVPLEKAIRPQAGWSTLPGMDWGDAIVDGKKVKRGG